LIGHTSKIHTGDNSFNTEKSTAVGFKRDGEPKAITTNE